MSEQGHLFTDDGGASAFDLARSYFMDVHWLSGSTHLVLKLLCLEQCLAYCGIESLDLVRWTRLHRP